MPPEDLLKTTMVTYEVKDEPVSYTVGYFFNYFWSLPEVSRPYVGDLHGIEQLALDAIIFDLEAAAGQELGLDRSRDVIWAAKKAREEFLIPRIEESFKAEVQVGDEEIAAYYDTHHSELHTPFTYRARRILVATESEADQILRELRAGKDFAQLATEKSIDPVSGPKGGDLGTLEAGMFAVYDSIAKAIRPGEISGAFSTPSGVEILKIEEESVPRELAFDEVRDYIRQTLQRDKANVLLQRWVSDKETSVGYWINAPLLAKLQLPEPEWKGTVAREIEESEETQAPGQPLMGRKARERARRGE
jgi:hypothetical protein